MRATVKGLIALASVLGGVPAAGTLAAQDLPAHVGHVADAFQEAPEGKGLLPTALAEAAVVAQHTLLASESTELDAIKRHAGHVMHAIDPTGVTSGPGLGFGLKRAAEAAANHIELAGKAEGAAQNVVTHSAHIAASARNTARRADEIIALTMQIQAASTAADAANLVAQLKALVDQVVPGVDANADGRVGWQEGEGGLQQAEQHMGLLKGM